MIVGIDFGTTKSVAAVMQSGTPIAIPDLQGRCSMPSLVMVAPDERLYIGWDALAHPFRYQSEYFTINSIKRLMGKTGETGWGRFRTYPQEVSALVLGRLKMQAEAYCDSEISKAVIAVPAHFDINQRWATTQAAEIAGLKVLRLLNEATAAVLTYSLLRGKQEGKTLVFDFGGGTLDVSIVSFGEGFYEVQCVSGDDRLGGDDFDQIILDYVLESIKKQCGTSLELSPMHYLILKEAAARAKIDLSGALNTRIYLPGFMCSTNRHYDVDVPLERGTFERLCNKLFERAETILRTAMEVQYRENPLTDVLLIGGTSRIPYIKESVWKITGLKPSVGIDPEVGVAQGASILAGCLSGELRNLLLLDVVPGTYSLAVKGDVAEPLIWRNTNIPTKNSHTFTTTKDNQTELIVSVYQGEKTAASQNNFVGEVRLPGIPPAPAGMPQIEVTFDVDANNSLAVSAKDKATGHEVRVVMEAPYRLNPAQMKVLQRRVDQELHAIRQQETEARERERVEVARRAAISLLKRIEGLLAVYGDALEANQISLLVAGKGVIGDYLAWHVPGKDLQVLVSSVRLTYKDAFLTIAQHAARLAAYSPELAQWMANAESNWQIPALLKTSFEEFGNRFKNAVERVVALFRNEDATSLKRLGQELLDRLRDSPTVALCTAIILSHFAGLHPKVQGLNITEAKDAFLFRIFLLGELAEHNPPTVRQAAAHELFLAYKGTDCFFLVDYLAAERDPEIASLLEKCLGEIPVGCWLRRFIAAEPAEKKGLTANAVTLREVRRDSVRALSDLASSTMHLSALEILEVLGVEKCLPDLLPLLSISLDDETKIRLISLVASSRQKQVIEPLLKALVDESLAVRGAVLVALEGCQSLMASDVRRFFGIAQQVIAREKPITLWQRPFLLGFARGHKELGEVVRVLEKKR